jgi:hypothetical protein
MAFLILNVHEVSEVFPLADRSHRVDGQVELVGHQSVVIADAGQIFKGQVANQADPFAITIPREQMKYY